jgi:pantoate--beta-alanine ligase
MTAASEGRSVEAPAARPGTGVLPVLRRIDDPAAMRAEVLAARTAGRRVGFVPTMGALHQGHASLVEAAAAECDDVAVSIFVNPTQFGPGEDFTRYPRPLAADLSLLAGLGVRWAFVPEAEALYPPGAATRIVVEGPARGFEGDLRPGHFSGVATVVCRLFQAVPADAAYFGAKDWQQTRVVERMVRDLGLQVGLRVCPTIREPDGLALSSRNVYLGPDERRRATALVESLRLAATMWDTGGEVAAIEAAMRDLLAGHGLAVDYAAIVDAESLAAPQPARPAVALVAGRLGSTRLLDNAPLAPRSTGAWGGRN